MCEGSSIDVSVADRERLAAVVVDRNSPQKHVWRTWIIRHQEFIRFLNQIEAVVPAGKLIHAILDSGQLRRP
jgi:hypothetical protein